MVDKIVTHCRTVLHLAVKHGWLIGAQYTNLRNVSDFEKVSFIDIFWKNYAYKRHLIAAKEYQPKYTVAKDWESASELKGILKQAHTLSNYCEHVIIVPKVDSLKSKMLKLIPRDFILTRHVGLVLPLNRSRRKMETRTAWRMIYVAEKADLTFLQAVAKSATKFSKCFPTYRKANTDPIIMAALITGLNF